MLGGGGGSHFCNSGGSRFTNNVTKQKRLEKDKHGFNWMLRKLVKKYGNFID